MAPGSEHLLAACLGVGLSAACGLRVFIPPLMLAVAAAFGWVPLGADMQWLASPLAIAALAIAATIEVGAMYIPWLDHALDVMAAPVAMTAGALLSVGLLGDVDPTIRWTAGVIAGATAAGTVHTGTALLRAGSTATTGGLGNPIVASAELGGALFASVVVLLAPVFAAGMFVLALVGAVMLWRRWRAA